MSFLVAGNSSENISVNGGGFTELVSKLGREDLLELLLSQAFCHSCQHKLETRIHQHLLNNSSLSNNHSHRQEDCECNDVSSTFSKASILITTSDSQLSSTQVELNSTAFSPVSVNSKHHVHKGSGFELLLNDGLSKDSQPTRDDYLSEEQKEHIRFKEVGRKKDFVYNERIDGKLINVIQGLELHTKVFNAQEQKNIVECVYDLQRMGQKGRLKDRTYSEPSKWMRGKGRVTMQFGCCYNYAVGKDGSAPGIMRDEEVDHLPPLFKQMIKRLVRWHVLPPTCVPDSCIVNIYEEGDCIPPHIDHHDFVRPFCTVSFLTECNILFGSRLKILNPGEFSGPVSIPLPIGSVLILKGNGADVAKHCVPSVHAKRISITFRKMDDSKVPYMFSPEHELSGIKPLMINGTGLPLNKQSRDEYHKNSTSSSSGVESGTKTTLMTGTDSPSNKEKPPSWGNPYHENGTASSKSSSDNFVVNRDEFPTLGSSVSIHNRSKFKTNTNKHK